YTHATALVYPSLYEGFGFPVVEAMACGTPVLTSRSSSLAEIGEGAALLVDPRDETEMAEGLRALATPAELREDLRRRGPARAGRSSRGRAPRASRWPPTARPQASSTLRSLLPLRWTPPVRSLPDHRDTTCSDCAGERQGRWEEPRGPAARLEARGHGGRSALGPQGAGDRAHAGRGTRAGRAAPFPRAGRALRGVPGRPGPAAARRARAPRRGSALPAPA